MYYNIIKKNYIEKLNKKSDINEHLPKLYDLAKKCEHITEFGVRKVVSTWAFLLGKPKSLTCYDIYKDPNVDAIEKCAKGINCFFKFVTADTRNITIEKTDLLFIDTAHTYLQISKELELHGNKSRKYIVMHDTTLFGYTDEERYLEIEKKNPEYKDEGHGIVLAILNFMDLYPNWKIIYQVDFCNGLTVLSRVE